MKTMLWVIVLGFFIFFSSLGQTLGQSAPPKNT
jgi:hypothetical protein